MHKKTNLRLIPALLAIAFAGGANAAGFALQNQNASGTGYAFAGAAAVAEDASTIYFNPAGMTNLPLGHNFSFAASAIDRSVKFSDGGTQPYAVPGALGSRTVGNDGGDGGGTAFVPALYWAWAITPALRVGLGVSAPYGSKTEYDSDFIGRFSGYYTSIETMNINPSIAYKFNDVVSVGFGVNYSKTDLELRQAVPLVGVIPGTTTRVLGGESQATVKGDGTAWGWNIGATFQVTPATRLGVVYRSTLKTDLDGTQTVAANPSVRFGGASYGVKSEIELPDHFSLALSQKIGDSLELLADVTWTGWSSVKALTATNSVNQPPATVIFDYDDAWRFGLGAKYQINPQWSLRFGTAYDQTPVKNAETRTMTVPDSDRIWLAFGARWQFMKQASLDFGYAHIFFDDAPVNRPVTVPGTTATAQTIKGEFDVSANIFSAQLNYNFQ